MTHVSRRRLLALGAAAGVSLLLPSCGRNAAAAAAESANGRHGGRGIRGEDVKAVRIGVLSPASGPLAARAERLGRGVQLGRQEAARAGELLGATVELYPARGDDPRALGAAAERLVDARAVIALIGGFDAATCEAVGAVAEERRVVFLNVGCADDELRGERCLRHTFHVAASGAMRRDALDQAPPGAPEPLDVLLWHHTLGRYGAAQLNERFRDAFELPMDSDAWAGWMAVKLIWESALRTNMGSAAELVRFLESDRARFDGHKGRALTFRPWDHQLRQPLYLVPRTAEATLSGERGGARSEAAAGATPEPAAGARAEPAAVVAEVPATVPGEQEGSAEVLDRLGVSESESRCALARGGAEQR